MPRAFVSHASEDKPRFVLAFAERLLANGVDAWVDRWEMAGGDSLVERIFEEGIKGADAILVVVSEFSVIKPWVREELDSAVVSRIEKRTRLIPIVLDDVEVPQAIKHLLHYNLQHLGFEGVLDGVLRTLFAVSSKPPLGEPPAYATSTHGAGLMDDPVDDVVLAAFLRKFREQDRRLVWQSTALQPTVAEKGISESAFRESVEVLVNRGLIRGKRMLGGQYLMDGPSTRLWLEDEQRRGLDLDEIRKRLLSAIVNDGTRGDWSAFADLHWRTLHLLLSEFDAEGLVNLHLPMGGPFVAQVSPLAARRLRSMG